MAYVASIAGTDSSGGAGNQADVACIQALGHHTLSVITAVTTQDTEGVKHVAFSDNGTLKAQLNAVFGSYELDAIKSGMLPKDAGIQLIATTLQAQTHHLPYVLDPVMRASSGKSLLDKDSQHAMVKYLFPLATVVTPNIPEAEILTGRNITTMDETVAAARDILELGCNAVLIKGGHSRNEPGVDVLLDSRDVDVPQSVHCRYIEDRSPRGTGCSYASAIACGLASQLSLYEAILNAKKYITLAIENSYRVKSDFWLLNHQVAADEL